MADWLTAVFPTVTSLFTDSVTSSRRRRCTLHCLFSLTTSTGLCGESQTRRTRTRMTEDVTTMWTILVSLPATNLSTAVWSDVLMILGVLHFTYGKSRYDSVYLMCSKKRTDSQLGPPHGNSVFPTDSLKSGKLCETFFKIKKHK